MDETTEQDVQGTPDGEAPEAQEAEVPETIEADVEQAPEPVQPEPTPDPVVEETEAPEDPTGPVQEGEDKDEQKRAALDRKMSRENQSLRKRLREAEQRVKEFEDAQLSEQERQQARLNELEEKYSAAEQRLRESSLNIAATNEAIRLNVIDPEAVIKMLDKSSLDYDSETDSWVGVEEAVAALVEDKSYLVKQPDPVQPAKPKDAAPANPARRRTRLTRDALAKMTQDEIAALPKEELHSALASED